MVVRLMVALGGEGDALRAAAEHYLGDAIERHVGRARDELAAGLAAGELVERLDAWESERAEALAAEECDHLADRLLAAGFDEEGEDDG